MVRGPAFLGSPFSSLHFSCSIFGRLQRPKIGATGFEPESHSASSNCDSCSCVDCEMCRAANVLHSRRFQWLELALNDADLQRVMAAWATLPDPIRKAVKALVDSQR